MIVCLKEKLEKMIGLRSHGVPLSSFLQGDARDRPTGRFLGIKAVLALTVVVILIQQPRSTSAETFRNCGGFLTELRGVVHSPFFPNRFPLPISCRWIIHAPPEKKIVLYFTQYFLREAFRITAYEQYVNEQTYGGRESLGEFNFIEHIRTLVTYKPFLVLDFRLHQMANVHLRVEEYLVDVYGFNITYEVMDRTEEVRQDTCTVNDCSFLGHCLASADFSSYKCVCFPAFFGNECQYGPFCDPDKGINMCLNQGKCRYFSGSTINTCECPPGYVGPKCEQKTDHLDGECAKLGCSDDCKRNFDGQLYCACQDGFKLDTDNVTCIEQELYRVSVTVPQLNPSPEWNKELITTETLSRLQQSGLRTAKRFVYDGANSTGGQDVKMFHFYVDRSELPDVKEAIQNLMDRNALLNLTVVSINPEMKLLSVANYGANPALEGKSLYLMCTARGSEKLQFRWYKDQFLFNATLTSRSAREVRVQGDYDDKQMSIFNIDEVTKFDKGEFSCEIEDFGQMENKTVTVDVMPLPEVEIKPLIASVLQGQSVSFRCLSPDESMMTFSFQWLRDGQKLQEVESVNGEIVEDLHPSGSRIFIPRLQIRANYTCRVVNEAGASEKSAFVYVISPNMSEMVCEGETYHGVKWNRTYGGYYDLQRCPIDTADFRVVGLGEGYTRRDCFCDASSCYWGPPNYARCTSVHLMYFYDELERCQLGYQQDGLSHIYDKLYQLLRKAQNRTLAGDVDMFATNLYTLFDVTLEFPAVAPNPSRSSFNLMTVASFMNIVLDEVKTTNAFEKRDLSVGARFVRVCEILAELTRENPSLIPLFNLTQPRIEFAVRNVTVLFHKSAEEMNGGPEVDDGEASLTHTGRQLMSLPPDVKPKKAETRTESEKELEILQVTISKDVFPILRVETPRSNYDEFLTPLVSLLPIGNSDVLDDFYRVSDGRVEVEFAHPLHVPMFVENITQCVAWDRRDSGQLVGEWNAAICDVIHRTANVTKCLCPVPGHYAVVVTATNNTLPPVVHIRRETVLLSGCILCMCGLTAVLLVYFVSWRHMSSDSSLIHLNLILSLAAINLVCILCVNHTEREVLCLVGKVMLHFFQLAAFTFLLMEAIHTYLCIQSTTVGGLSRIKHAYIKYTLTGWGIPSIAALAVYVLSVLIGFDDTCSTWCWWTVGEWQHFSFLVPLVVLVLVQVLIMSACLVCTRFWKDEYHYQDRRRYIYIAVRSFVLQTLVVLVSVSGHLTEIDASLGRQWFFVMMDILLTVTVIITLLVLKPHVRRVLISLLPANKRASAFSSFRAFVLPDRVEDSEELEVKRIQDYCTELDRSKFTSQHKQTLRNLLGSSSSGSDASASGTGSPPGSASASGQMLPTFSRRTQSAGSRSSCSDCGGSRGCAGEGSDGQTSRKAASKRNRGRRNPKSHHGSQSEPSSSERPAGVGGREGVPLPRHYQNQGQGCRHQCLMLDPGGLELGAEGEVGRDPTVPDSGYEGTESDNPSFRQGATFDLDSQVSSDCDTDLHGDRGDSPASSSGTPPLDPPSCSCLSSPPPPLPFHPLPLFRPSPARSTPSSRRSHSSSPASGPATERTDISDIVADVTLTSDVTSCPETTAVHQAEEDTTAAEHEALLSVPANNSELRFCDEVTAESYTKSNEYDTFL